LEVKVTECRIIEWLVEVLGEYFPWQAQERTSGPPSRIGKRVTFHPAGRPPVTGIITRYNKKTVSILTEDGQRWNVAPSFLERATPHASGSSDSTVVSIQERR